MGYATPQVPPERNRAPAFAGARFALRGRKPRNDVGKLTRQLARLLAYLLDQLDLLDVVAGGLAVEHHTLADDLHTAIQNKRWMCGFPDKLVIVTLDQYVVSMYGNEDLVNTFRDKLFASYSAAAVVYDEAIG